MKALRRSPSPWLKGFWILGGLLLAWMGRGPAWAATPAVRPTPLPQVATLTPTPTPVTGPVYVVQPGDTLAAIAYRFGLTVEELAQANGIADPNLLQPGQRLVIPGFEEVSGELTTVTVGYGETLPSLSRRYGVPLDLLRRLNRVTAPDQIVVGQPLVIPAAALDRPPQHRLQVRAGESLQLAAARAGVNPWVIVLADDLPGTWAALPAAVLSYPDPQATDGPGALPPEIEAVALKPQAWVQGQTAVVRVQVAAGAQVTLSGEWEGHTLHFFPLDDEGNTWVALQGVHALEDVGPHPLVLTLRLADGREMRFEQPVRVKAGDYGWEKLTVPAALLDPDVNRAENAELRELTSQATPTRYWDGPFQAPSPYPDCFTSWFGTRRSYNDGAYFGYHGGLDFCGGTGTPITAPADGVVVFAGPLEVRGNTTIIDHGWGVYTLYAHQQEILVEVGQKVHTGDLIGYVGGTGRVTGAHLHWEVRVNGVPVDPEEWLEQTFP